MNTSISFKDDTSRNLATCFVTLEIYWRTSAEISDCPSISFLSPFLQGSFRTSMIPRSCFCQITLKVMRRATSLTLHRMPSTTLLLTTGLWEPTPQSCRASISATGGENKEVFAHFSLQLAPCFFHLSVVIFIHLKGEG